MIRGFIFGLSVLLLSTGWARGGSSFSSSSSEGVRLDLGYMMLNTKDNASPDAAGNIAGSDSEVRTSYLDLKLGYLMGNNLYFGGNYSTYTRDVTSGLATKRNLLGFTMGYHNSGYFLDLSYFLSGSLSDKFVGGDSFTSPSGFGLEFGYEFMLSTNFYLGVEVSYKSLDFKKYKPSGGTEVSTTWNQNELYPMLNLGFVF